MFHQVTCLILLSNIVGELNAVSDVHNSVFADINLPEGFGDDENFDKSGFIPEVDFSHFFKRVDFDRSLDDMYNTPLLRPEVERRVDKNSKKINILTL